MATGTGGDFTKEGLKGGGSSLIGAGTGAKFDPLKDAAGTAAARRMGAVSPEVGDNAVTLTPKQAVAKNAAGFGVDIVNNAETEIVAQPLTTGDFGPRKAGVNMLKSTGGGALKLGAPGTIDAPAHGGRGPTARQCDGDVDGRAAVPQSSGVGCGSSEQFSLPSSSSQS